VTGRVAEVNPDAETVETRRRLAGGQVASGDREPLTVQELGKAAHAHAADAEEVEMADVPEVHE
jgi:hypothetical protein